MEGIQRIQRKVQPKKIALIERMNPTWVDLSINWFEYEPADYKRSLDQFKATTNKLAI